MLHAPENDGHCHLLVNEFAFFVPLDNGTEIGVGHDIARDEDEVVGDESRLVDFSQRVADGRSAVRDHVTHATTGTR